MSAEALNPNPPPTDRERHRQLDREIKEMISALTTRLNDLHHTRKPGAVSGPHLGEDNDEHGAAIITLAGTNTGATMRGELVDRHQKAAQLEHHEAVLPSDEQPEGSDTYVNSNFQAVNNSIMVGATYNSNDPGVHMEIEDRMDTHGRRIKKHGKRVRKGKELAQGNLSSEFSE